VSFEEHIKHLHNMWHYLFFIVLLKVKDPTEFTGPESYVTQMIKVSECITYSRVDPWFSTGRGGGGVLPLYLCGSIAGDASMSF
jgi:hypothetical protein